MRSSEILSRQVLAKDFANVTDILPRIRRHPSESQEALLLEALKVRFCIFHQSIHDSDSVVGIGIHIGRLNVSVTASDAPEELREISGISPDAFLHVSVAGTNAQQSRAIKSHKCNHRDACE